MTTSGVSTFNLDNASILLEAFDRVGIRQPEITRNQLKSATRSLNLELASWSNRGINLWKVDLQSVSLVQGTATYDVDDDTVSILDAYIETQSGDADPIDRIILPISRTDYANFPDKTQQAPPTVYWFDRLESPTITLWAVPDGNGPYTLFYYRMTRAENANPTMGETPDIPFTFLEALCAGVAARLAQKYQPAIYMQMKQEAQAAWAEAALENREMVDTFIMPNLQGYWT